jgi:multidrug resistance protein MdtO
MMEGSAAIRLVRDELALTPDRWARMLRMTALVTVVVIVSNALRVPNLALSAYMIFFFSKSDVVATVRTGIAGVVGLTLVLTLAFVVYSVTLGEPALRLLAMGCAIFGGFYLLRSSPVGPLGLLIGLAISYALALVDSNASPEKLTRELLWIWVVISYPIALLVVSDLALGRRPEELFRRGISARLRAAGAFLAGDPDDDARARREFEWLERMGTGDISPYANAGPGAAAGTRTRLLAQLDLLLLLVRELPPDAKRSHALARALVAAGEACLAASDAVLAGRRVLPGFLASWQHELAGRTDLPADVLAVALPLLSCVTDIGSCLVELHDAPSAAPSPKPRAEAANAAPSNHTEAVQFALKVTLASMTAYILYTSLDWWGIHTAMLTCFLVAQDSAGATIHKLTLRIAGALIGGALGIASIVFVLPQLETVGGLALLVAAVTLLAAWIATARETISYAGWQIAFAFYLTVLQGFSRTSKMVVGRDRVIGILLGNLIMSVVFTTVWPDRIKTVLREALGRAVQSLADALRLPSNRTTEAQLAFRAELQKVKQSGLQATFEPGGGDLSPPVAAIESLFVPIHALIQQPLDSHLVSQGDAAALRAAGETAAKRLSDLAAAIPELRPIPPFQGPAILPAVDGDPRARLQAKWFELLEDRISHLAAETRRAAAAEGTP